MKFKEIIKWIEKVGGDVVSFIKLKPYIALIIAGTVAAAGITIYHCASSSDNDKNIEINMDEINEEQKYTEVKMLYDDTVFMNGNNIFSDTEREENRNFLDTIKEKIDDKTLSNDEIDRLETLNELLTNIAATNKKSMEDALGQIKTQYLIISDGDETVEGYTVISVSKEEKLNYEEILNEIDNSIKNGYFLYANEKIVELSEFISSHNKATGEIIETKVEPDGTIKVVPITASSDNNDTGSNTGNNSQQKSSLSNSTGSGSDGNSHGGSSDSGISSPSDNGSNPVSNPTPKPAPTPAPTPKPQEEEKPKAPKYTKEQNDLINNILNQWFDLEISEEEANAKLRSSFPGMNMVTKHIGNEAEARALWNSLGDEYLKSNILISNKYGSYFIYGK